MPTIRSVKQQKPAAILKKLIRLSEEMENVLQHAQIMSLLIPLVASQRRNVRLDQLTVLILIARCLEEMELVMLNV
jgi:hypothetical protein